MNLKEKLKEKVKASVNTYIDYEYDEWPPKCFGYFYQPERPQLTKNKEITDEEM